LDVGAKGVTLSFRNNVFPNVEQLISYVQNQRGKAHIRPDQKVVFNQIWKDELEQFNHIKKILEEIEEFV
jgi:transcription-repair coupling factor (superfamily II helicase)